MAARKLKPHHQDDIRAKIQTVVLIVMVQEYARDGVISERQPGGGSKRRLATADDAPIMAQRLKAALSLISKSLPDLQSMQLQAELTERFVARTPLVEKTTEQWQEKYSPQTVQ